MLYLCFTWLMTTTLDKVINWIELFVWYGWPTQDVKPYFQPGPLSEILTIANLRQAGSRISACAEPEFRLWWMKLCSSDNHYTTVPTQYWVTTHKPVSFFDHVIMWSLMTNKSYVFNSTSLKDTKQTWQVISLWYGTNIHS